MMGLVYQVVNKITRKFEKIYKEKGNRVNLQKIGDIIVVIFLQL